MRPIEVKVAYDEDLRAITLAIVFDERPVPLSPAAINQMDATEAEKAALIACFSVQTALRDLAGEFDFSEKHEDESPLFEDPNLEFQDPAYEARWRKMLSALNQAFSQQVRDALDGRKMLNRVEAHSLADAALHFAAGVGRWRYGLKGGIPENHALTNAIAEAIWTHLVQADADAHRPLFNYHEFIAILESRQHDDLMRRIRDAGWLGHLADLPEEFARGIIRSQLTTAAIHALSLGCTQETLRSSAFQARSVVLAANLETCLFQLVEEEKRRTAQLACPN